MYAFFPIICSLGFSSVIALSFLFSFIPVWSLLLTCLFFCFCLTVVATLESSIWCYIEETMTEDWFKLFVLGEFILFLSLMLPICYINDNLGEEALSDPFGIPLLGVFVLLLSSLTVSNFENELENFEKVSLSNLNFTNLLSNSSKFWLLLTIVNGLGFILLQIIEFYNCPASVINTAWFSSCLVLVSFHGFHVFVGLIFLSWVYFRLYNNNNILSVENYVNQFRLIHFTCFYWHFVDFIWFIVYFLVYFIP